VKNAILILTIPLRILAAGMAFVTGFGYLFFLGSQDTITTAYAVATIFALGYFALSPRSHWVTRGNLLLVLIMSALAVISAVAQLLKFDREFFENADAFGSFVFPLALVIAMVVEAHYRFRTAGVSTSRPNPSINPDAAR
jgi:hypothetical protein